MACITDISTSVPEHLVNQSDFARLYGGLTKDMEVQRKINFITRKSGIHARHTVLEDLTKVFSMRLEEKMNLYHQEAMKLVFDAVNKLNDKHELKDVTDIVLVSCTGMAAPGLEFDVINEFQLPKTIKRHNIHFMGCYAGIIGLRQAQMICDQREAKVLLIDVELCTLHFQKLFNADYLLSNTIFADGCAAAIVESNGHKGLKINSSNSVFLEETAEEMSWRISEHGFLMTLDSKVPNSIRQALKDLPVKEETQIAMHPGGIQILRAGEEVLGKDLAPSYKVLKSYGNMSSATIFFVLNRMLNEEKPIKEVLGLAFGPGLTVETISLTHV